jgi:hypothetical protein
VGTIFYFLEVVVSNSIGNNKNIQIFFISVDLVEKVQQNSRLFFNHFGQVAKWAFLRMHQGHKLCKV